MAHRAPRVFTIPSGAPFLPTLSRALLDGVLIDGFPGAGGPIALADATIYVPTQRAAQALTRALLSASGASSLLLPRIAPLGAFEPDETATVFDPEGEELPRAAVPPAVGALTRRHALATLTRAWGKALRGAIRQADADGRLIVDPAEPALVAATPAQAYALAGDLAMLIDDMIIEGAPWTKLETLAPDLYDPYWRITLDFLKIAFAHWPEWLAKRGLIDRAKRVALLIEDEIKALEGARRGPTIIAGSTGANRATARLIAAIARDPQGAVVLPDLDLNLDDRTWAMIGGRDDGSLGLAGHAQALLHQLIGAIGVKREEVTTLGAPSPALAARCAFLSEALRPAESTDLWRERGWTLSPLALAAALQGVTIIVADNENEEALALAIAMRETLETPGKTAALITPDPSIARRVSAELARWAVEVEDSAGRTLGQSLVGALARLILVAAIEFTPRSFLALLAHPSVRFGRSFGQLEAATRALELAVFRAVPLASLDDLERAFTAARAAADDRHAHPAIRRISEANRRAAEALARDVASALAPVRALGRSASLRDCLTQHRAAIAAAVAGPHGSMENAHGFEQLTQLMDEWSGAGVENFPAALHEYAALFDDALAAARAPAASGGHPRLMILGLLEARLLSFDRVLLAGLDETVWPPAVGTDAFLNRPMRAALGLSSPERRIGQTAHDFVAALGAREAILSRAKNRGGQPTVASRFLQRMAAAAGPGAMAEPEERGERYLGFARALDQPADFRPQRRPAPRPPVELRPKGLSVTRIETLRRDPYAIYAEYILSLKALEAVEREIGPRETGMAWHATLQQFVEAYPSGALPSEARDRLLSIARACFALLRDDPAFALHWPNIEKGLDFFLAFERKTRGAITQIWVERQGAIVVPLDSGIPFKLSARADRIDVLQSGGARLIDYKSGALPIAKEVKAGFSPQLTLEAAMLQQGGFKGLPPLEAEQAIYLKLGGASGGEEKHAGGKGEKILELAEQHCAGLKMLLDTFACKDTPYLSRPFPRFVPRFSDYDHLGRVKEWSATGGESDSGDAQ
ncbi:MAG TPA: double-strand break repair protein AddB [Roseiarcus sp.]